MVLRRGAPLFLSMSLLVVAMACGTGTAANDRLEDTASGSSLSTSEVFLPKQRPDRNQDMPTAMNGGELVVDHKGCLRMKNSARDPGYVPVWPPDFRLVAGRGEVRLLDGKGRLKAIVGKKVVMGGGEVRRDTLRENGIVDEQTWRELVERCPQHVYWIAGAGINTSQQR